MKRPKNERFAPSLRVGTVENSDQGSLSNSPLAEDSDGSLYRASFRRLKTS